MKTSFIGLGIMGSRMAANLAKNKIDITIYNRTPGKMNALAELGAKTSGSLADCVKDADIVLTMLSTPEAVWEYAAGEDGFLGEMKHGAHWCDCTTVNPDFSREMAKLSESFGLRFMDTPVAGSKKPAEEGSLVFLCGGNENDLEEIKPFLNIMGSKIIHAGGHGMGSSLKMAVNMLLANSMAAFAESVAFGEKIGLERDKLMDILAELPVTAPFNKLKKEKMKSGDFSPEFPLEWMHKDLHLACLTAYEYNISLPAANAVKEMFASANQSGWGREDLSAIFKIYNKEK